MINKISSKENKIVKLVRSLHLSNGRKKTGKFFVEGTRIVEEALEYAKDCIEAVVFSDTFYETNKSFVLTLSEKTECYMLSDNLFSDISDTKTPQGIMAVLTAKKNIKDFMFDEKNVLILDSVQDPGNMGTIIRTAEAMGIKSIFLLKGCADIYSPKVTRSTMGSVFRTEFYNIDCNFISEHLKPKGYTVYATALKNNSISLEKTILNKKNALIIGNEARGVSENILNISDETIKIPMQGNVESLNAAVAAAVVMYHFSVN